MVCLGHLDLHLLCTPRRRRPGHEHHGRVRVTHVVGMAIAGPWLSADRTEVGFARYVVPAEARSP